MMKRTSTGTDGASAGWYQRDLYGEAMMVTFSDMEWTANPRNGEIISKPYDLMEILESLRTREPFVFELKGSSGFTLQIGIAGSCGFVEYSRDDGSADWVAIAPGEKQILSDQGCVAFREMADNGVEFLCGGTPSPIPSRYILSFELLQRIAMYFWQTGERMPEILWDEL